MKMRVAKALFFVFLLCVIFLTTGNASSVFAVYSTITTSTNVTALQPSHLRRMVATSEGTTHAFIQLGTSTMTCSGSPTSGLIYMKSSDSGANWTCVAQLSSDTTNLYFPDVKVDSSDNIYLTYSLLANGGDSNGDVYYQKLSKISGSNWTINSAQKVLDGNGTTAYTYATLAVQGTSKVWVATRYFDGTNYQISAYVSDSVGTAPSWTLSEDALDTPTTRSAFHYPILERYGSATALVSFDDDADTGAWMWRFHRDADGDTVWYGNVIIGLAPFGYAPASLIGDTAGRLYFAQSNTAAVYLYTFNTVNWTYHESAVLTNGILVNGVSLQTDGNTVWGTFDSDDQTGTAYAADLPGERRLEYKSYPSSYDAFVDDPFPHVILDTASGNFESVWVYDDSAVTKYASETTDASDNGSADVLHATSGRMIKDTSDAIYFGNSTDFDAISFAVSTNASLGAGTIVWEYCSAVDGSSNCTTWSTLSFTSSSNINFTGDGYGSFTPPGDWVAGKVDTDASSYYYIRSRVTATITTGPIGTQMVAHAPITGVASAYNTAAGKIVTLYTENTASLARYKSISYDVTAQALGNPQNIANLITHAGSPDESNPSYANEYVPNDHQRIVETSDGTRHTFLQTGSLQQVCNGAYVNGLLWFQSEDSGSTWTCKGQLAADATPYLFATAAIDSSDNIYVVYSQDVETSGPAGCLAGASYDITYRKLTKGVGASWTLEAAQTVADGNSTTGYIHGSLVIEGSSKIWIAMRSCVAATGIPTVRIDYTTNFTAAPTWQTSVSSLATDSQGDTYLVPTLVRYGSRTGIVYVNSTDTMKWHSRADSDGATTWSSATDIATTFLTHNTTCSNNGVSLIGTTTGKVFILSRDCTDDWNYFIYYNGSSWVSPAPLTYTYDIYRAQNLVIDDDENIWVAYADRDNIVSGLPIFGQIYAKKIRYPVRTTFDIGTPAIFNPRDRFFDSIQSSVSSVFTDYTTAATNITAGDIHPILTNVDDLLYFGDATKFDYLYWGLSVTGVSGKGIWEYYDGTTWKPLQNHLVQNHGANNPGAWFTGNGGLSFIPQSDWATVSINGSASLYYIRFRLTTVYGVSKPRGSQFYTMAATGAMSVLGHVTDINDTVPLVYTDFHKENRTTRYQYGNGVLPDLADDATDPACTATYDESFENTFPATDWSTSGNANWVQTTAQALDGTQSIKSGAITHSQTSTVTLTVNLPTTGEMRFFWKASSEEDFDYGVFCIDTPTCDASTGYTNRVSGQSILWEGVRADLTAGAHTLTWKYIKDSSASDLDDTIYIDSVALWLTGDPVLCPTPTPTPSPSPSATPTPTTTPEAGPGPTTSNPTAMSCTLPPPPTAPDLFQIVVNGTQATLYFTPVNSNTDRYHVYYGLSADSFAYGESFLYGPSSGVIAHTISNLQPNQEYVFAVKAINECAGGPLSGLIKINTATPVEEELNRKGGAEVLGAEYVGPKIYVADPTGGSKITTTTHFKDLTYLEVTERRVGFFTAIGSFFHTLF